MKKVLALILAVWMLIAASPAVLAQTAVSTVVQDRSTFEAPGGFPSREPDLQAMEQYLFEQFAACTPVIDMADFGLRGSEENMNLIWELVYYEMVDSFHVTSVGISYTSFRILSLEPVYDCDAEEYAKKYAICQEKAAELLAGIEGNEALSDVDKALLLHDRIALITQYDHDGAQSGEIPPDSFTMYGVLGKGLAVCQGYAETYKYLLDRIGIENEMCTSEALNHAWNILYIDGVPYHVDITWDDSSGSRVYHYCFLISTDALYANGHEADDYNTAPSDTRYEDAEWQQVTSAYHLITLDANGGTVDTTYLVASSEAAVIPPTPTRAGYDFLGWASAPGAATGTTDIKARESQTYFAVWQAKDQAVTALEVTSAPTKTTYFIGEALDTSGLRLTLTYADGTTEILENGFAVDGFDANTLGMQTVTVTFGGASASFEVYVEARPLLAGDVDESGVVDVADILKLRDIILDEVWDDAQLALGDLDQSGELDVADIIGVKSIILAA